jgi:Flp pilus assembly protein TadD
MHDLLGIDATDLAAVYASACRQLAAGTLVSAAKLFAVLVALDHKDGRYWRGLAVSMQRMRVFPLAELLYSIAIRIDEKDVVSRVLRAEVMLQQGRKITAWLELDAAIDLLNRDNSAEHHVYKQRAETLREMIRVSDTAGEFTK